MKKLFVTFLSVIMVMVFMPTMVFAAETAPKYDSISNYTDDAASGKLNGQDVYVTIERQTFNADNLFKVCNTQNNEDPPKLHLTIKDCAFEGNTAGDSSNPSFMYLSNCKELIIDNCDFDAGSGLKYGINWNLIGVQNATVSITNCDFTGNYTTNAIKITQRGGDGDTKNQGEQFQGAAGTIDSVDISGCTFSDTAKVAFGTQAKGFDFTTGDAVPDGEKVANVNSGAFAVKMSGNSNLTVSEQYLANQTGNPVETAIPKGAVIEKAKDDFIAGSEAYPFTDIDDYSAAVKMHGFDGKDVYVNISNKTFDASEGEYFKVENVQKYAEPPKLHLTLTNCKFTGNTANDSGNPSFMYLPNCQSLDVSGCEFTAVDNQAYGINWNLIGIQNATVSIKDSTFTGPFEKNALKLNQRNGGDDQASDVKGGNVQAASIKSAVIEGCTFNNAVISLGSQGKNTNGEASPSTGAFPIVIQNNKTAVQVEQAYLAATSDKIPTVDLTAGETLVKSAEGDVHAPVTKVEYKAPTATEPGNIEYWYCGHCGKYYSDEALTEVIDLSDTVIPATGTGSEQTDDETDVDNTPTDNTEKNPADQNKGDENSEKVPDKNIPETNDMNDALPWMILMAVAAGAALAVKRKESAGK